MFPCAGRHHNAPLPDTVRCCQNMRTGFYSPFYLLPLALGPMADVPPMSKTMCGSIPKRGYHPSASQSLLVPWSPLGPIPSPALGSAGGGGCGLCDVGAWSTHCHCRRVRLDPQVSGCPFDMAGHVTGWPGPGGCPSFFLRMTLLSSWMSLSLMGEGGCMFLFLGFSREVSALGLLPSVATCSQSLASAREGSTFLSREAVLVGLGPWAEALSLSRFKPLSRDRALGTEGPTTL